MSTDARVRRLTGVAALAIAGAWIVLPARPASAAVPAPITWTDPTQVFSGTVPAGVCGILFDAYGANGGAASTSTVTYPIGGTSGHVSATFAVAAGDPYTVAVGGSAASGGLSGGSPSGGAGGYLSAVYSDTERRGGRGGGASIITLRGTRVLAAGGGGGAGLAGSNPIHGGNVFRSGFNGSLSGNATGGFGGDPSDPGDGGLHSGPGFDGQPGVGTVGGAAANQPTGAFTIPQPDAVAGGGGGGSLAGGGGAVTTNYPQSAGGGGGGSSFGPSSAVYTFGGAVSGSVTATFQPCAAAPSPPLTLVATPGSLPGTADLTFTRPADDSGLALTYEVRSMPVTGTSFGAWQPLTTRGTAVLLGTLSALAPGGSSIVQVRAHSTAGYSDPSNAAPVMLPAAPPGPPTVLNGVLSAGTVTLSWGPPVSDGGGTITSYQVRPSPTGQWVTAGDGSTRTYPLTGLTPGTAYQVEVRAVNSSGGGASAYCSIAAASVPDAPTIARLTPGNHRLGVTVDPGAEHGSPTTGYEYSLDGGSFSTLTQNTITGLTNGRAYTVRVRAVSAVGNSLPSDPVDGTPVADRPGPPSIQGGPLGDRRITLAFTPPADDGGSAITGYVYQLDTGSGYGAQITLPGNHVIDGLTAGGEYAIRLSAVTTSGAGAPSAEYAFIAQGTPDAPGVVVTDGNGQAELTITDNADNGQEITGYEYSLNGSAFIALSQPIIIGLTNGTTYQLRVRSANNLGPGPSTEVTLAPRPDLPAAPTALSPTYGDGTATITYTAPTDDGGSPITGYEYRLDGGTEVALPDPPTVPDLTGGTAYAYEMRTITAAGHSPWSDVLTLHAITVPDAPGTFVATGGDAQLTVTYDPAAANGGTVSGYEVSLDGGVHWSPLDPTGVVGSLTNGQTYQVAVRALNEVGAGPATEVQAVTPQTFATPLQPPDPPTGVQLVAGTSSLRVSWTASAGATGYTATASPGPATCETSGTSCVLGAVAGISYTVTVTAHSTGGDSTPSDSATAALPALPAPPAAPPAPTPGSDPLSTTDGPIDTVTPGQQLTVVGDGYAAYSTVLVTAYSTAVVLGRAVAAADGTFSLPVTLPGDLVAGSHTIAALGVDPNGNDRTTTLSVTVAAVSTPAAPVDGGTQLPRTGGGLVVPGMFLLVIGLALVVIGRRRSV